jgi:hypothetical protein
MCNGDMTEGADRVAQYRSQVYVARQSFGDRLGDGRQRHSPLRDGGLLEAVPAYNEEMGISIKNCVKKKGRRFFAQLV